MSIAIARRRHQRPARAREGETRARRGVVLAQQRRAARLPFSARSRGAPQGRYASRHAVPRGPTSPSSFNLRPRLSARAGAPCRWGLGLLLIAPRRRCRGVVRPSLRPRARGRGSRRTTRGGGRVPVDAGDDTAPMPAFPFFHLTRFWPNAPDPRRGC
ncbi:hypothetical protein BC628DRAFT_1192347 [Trametes gibbosa]|nr:hypothetical protein BC628DRAFT_1192347 [Trametes gibbosa]